MRKFSVFFLALFFTFTLSAQWQRAFLAADGQIGVRPVPAPVEAGARSDEDGFAQISGFPQGVPANPVFKNLRNLTLADLDDDGAEEILIGIDDEFYVFKNDQLLWQRHLEGIAVYPPSVADVDDDGSPEIVQITGGTGSTAAYMFEADGSDAPNWPLDFNDNWLLTSPTLVDVDGDRIMEIIILERIAPNGNIHLLRVDGTSYSPNWPVAVEATPAVTPSAGDVDDDGAMEIVMNTTEARYVLNLDGQFEDGFPVVTHPRQRYSYQSPILADLDDDGDLEIIGATHSDNQINLPEFYVMQHDGSDYPGWPMPVPGQAWTFNTPTVAEIDGSYRIFMSRPIDSNEADMLYCWDKDGNLFPGFPIVKPGGLEGIISLADVDGDGEQEIVFGTNLIDPDGMGRIHAYELDGTGEVAGFPIHTYGWTFLNGAAFGDVDGNDTLDLVALSYTQTFNQGIDSTFINVYNLGVPYTESSVLWGTYKGSNTRQGLVGEAIVLAAPVLEVEALNLQLFPNPTSAFSRLSLELPAAGKVQLELLSVEGKHLRSVYQGQRPAGPWQVDLDLSAYPAGMYFARLQIDGKSALIRISKVTRK
ncbi:T9SS type A sorting domain-containing protein [Flavilitoribacter nigricans]|uniref:Secretion system C-terminal sorting domain-containing protein n=1 Tax=Flavilitoribacter nigricans (strain ATCC 23147 / DSM 23189 / NBRC 102662 / NCIMB 1420 / SS-2) TaxID=1122177 RepID=A0A2D0N6D3_FLAN2|nr:T9SS type A sorting domain-containing protein [Flavilitoribacter nigricans]PHN03940.1 hypothetical protein CRP01_24015 [Flavilitoribacter nigricans DSM 23189 = NBRC 102662]